MSDPLQISFNSSLDIISRGSRSLTKFNMFNMNIGKIGETCPADLRFHLILYRRMSNIDGFSYLLSDALFVTFCSRKVVALADMCVFDFVCFVW